MYVRYEDLELMVSMQLTAGADIEPLMCAKRNIEYIQDSWRQVAKVFEYHLRVNE